MPELATATQATAVQPALDIAVSNTPKLRHRMTVRQQRVFATTLEYLEYHLSSIEDNRRGGTSAAKQRMLQFWFPRTHNALNKKSDTANRPAVSASNMASYRAHYRLFRNHDIPQEITTPGSKGAYPGKLRKLDRNGLRTLMTLVFAVATRDYAERSMADFMRYNDQFARENKDAYNGLKRKLEHFTLDKLIKRWGPIPLPAGYVWRVGRDGTTSINGLAPFHGAA